MQSNNLHNDAQKEVGQLHKDVRLGQLVDRFFAENNDLYVYLQEIALKSDEDFKSAMLNVSPTDSALIWQLQKDCLVKREMLNVLFDIKKKADESAQRLKEMNQQGYTD